jgi:hypothetical protein
MANHHDNLDMWNSKYQQWDSVKVASHGADKITKIELPGSKEKIKWHQNADYF